MSRLALLELYVPITNGRCHYLTCEIKFHGCNIELLIPGHGWGEKRIFLSWCSGPNMTLENPIKCVQFGPFPWSADLHCAFQLAWIVVSMSHSLEPSPAVAPTKLRCWPTWNTIQDSTGPLTLHTLLDKICLCVATAVKKKPAFNNSNKTQILNTYGFVITCGTSVIINDLIKIILWDEKLR